MIRKTYFSRYYFSLIGFFPVQILLKLPIRAGTYLRLSCDPNHKEIGYLFRRPRDSVCFVSDVRNLLFKLILHTNIPVEYISQYESHRNLLVWLLAFSILSTAVHFEFVNQYFSIPSPPIIFNQVGKRGFEIFTECMGMESQ